MVIISGGNGTSIENAIIISDCNEKEGVDNEYKEVRKRFGNYKLKKQSLINKNNRMYDKLELLIIGTGNKIELYFDITDFFGKLN